MAAGTLRIQSYAARQSAPVAGVNVTVTGEGFTVSRLTDRAGNAADIEIEAPACSYSLDEANTTVQPYALCTLTAEKPGYQTIRIEGVQIFSGQVTLAPLEMIPANARLAEPAEPVVIPPHPLFAGQGGSGAAPEEKAASPRVLTAVVIPKTITVHLGAPTASARNVTVSFRDYIANVASSEVYPTWVTQNKPNISIRTCVVLEVPLDGDGLPPGLGVLRGNHHPMHQKYSQFPGQDRDFCQLCYPFHLSGAGVLPALLPAQVGLQRGDAGFGLLHLL